MCINICIVKINILFFLWHFTNKKIEEDRTKKIEIIKYYCDVMYIRKKFHKSRDIFLVKSLFQGNNIVKIF